jgi:hypothetical protein
LILAAGEVLYARFGTAGALSILRNIIDDTEAALITVHGRQSGEQVQ